jgi:hypothetical protein
VTGSTGSAQPAGLITNTESPSCSGNDQLPSVPVFTTSRPLDTITFGTPVRGELSASNTVPFAVAAG